MNPNKFNQSSKRFRHIRKATLIKSIILLVFASIILSHMVTPYFYKQNLNNFVDIRNNEPYILQNNNIISQNEPVLLWNYNTGSSIKSSPAISDINGDGKLEVIIGSDNNKIYALNGENGSLLWNYTTHGAVESSPAIGDINGDGKLEVVIGSNDNKIYALNGENGSLLWLYATGGVIRSIPALGDIDKDGKMEIIIISLEPKIYALNGEDGSLVWNCSINDYIESSPALGDIDGDGKLEVIIGSSYNTTRIYTLNGEDGSLLWSYNTGNWVRSTGALADVDGDGKLEIIIGSDNSRVYALNGEDGSLLWNYKTNKEVMSSPALGDIDGDGKLEVVIGSTDNKIYALNGEDGTLVWSYSTDDWIYSSPTLGDVDGDGKLEVIIGSNDNKLYALNGEDGSLLWYYITGNNIWSSPALGDIDGDGKLEVVIGSTDNKIYALDFPAQNSGFRKYWCCFGGLETNTRNLMNIDPDMDLLSNYTENILGTNTSNPDTDDDGMPDGWEVQYGLNATSNDANQDKDGDGLTNIEEYNYGTIPTNSDTDDDGMPDGWEVQYSLNATSNSDMGLDPDNDNLTNLQEYQHNTNPYDNDTDDDELSDGTEINMYSTDPLNNDTDGDGMPDGWEVHYSLDPTINESTNDPDGDNLTNMQEYHQGTDPHNNDTDSDGMPDGWEVQYQLDATNGNDAGLDLDNDNLTNLQEYQYGTDPTKSDSDNDEMPDGWEVQYGLNATDNSDASGDNDMDDLSNVLEFQHNTDPTNNDTDNDELLDGDEVNTYHTNPLSNDTDIDGMPDGWEVQYGFNPLLNDASEDSDSDGLTNLEEYQLGTNPTNPDTDNDSIPDGWEVENDFDPHQGMNALEIILYYEFYFILFSIIIGVSLYGKFILNITFTNTVKEAKRRIEQEEIFRIDSLPRSRAGFISRSPKSIIYKSAKSSDCPYEVHGEYLISKNLSAKLFSEIVKLSDTTKPISISEIERNLTIPIEDFDIKTYIEDYKDKFELNGIYLIQYMIYTQKFLEQLHHNLQIDANNQVITLDDWLRNKGIPDEDIKYIIELLVFKFDIKITKHGELISEKVMDAIYNSAIEIIKNKGRISIEELNSELKSIYNFKDITLDINRILEQPDIISSTDNTLLYTDEFIVNYLEKIFEIYQAYELNKLSKELNINQATLEARLIKLISEKKINARISNEEIFAIYTGDFTSVKRAPAVRKESSTIIIPGYKIISVIGTGGTATVFKAINPDNKPVALKIMNTYDKNFRQQFIREVSVWQVLDHKNIVKLLNYSTDPIPYIAMELMDGNLRDILNSNENISEKEAVRIIRDILTGIKYAHEEFLIVHRDIKPENILFKDNTFKLADWGLAKLQTSSSAHEYKGTIAYSAPEQFVSEFGKIAQWTDVWQVGAVLYELIAGKPPFGTNISEVINNVLQNDPTRPENISDELWNLITQMLKKNPKERISASKALRILNEF